MAGKANLFRALTVMMAAGALATCLLLVLVSAEPAAQAIQSKIAFTTDRDGNQEIYVMDDVDTRPADGNGDNATRLTNNSGADLFPAFTLDGSKIAFVSTRSGNQEIYVMNAAPEGSRNLPLNLTNDPANDFWPAFSPDGTKIAFVSPRSGNQDVWVMNSAGSNLLNLTSNPAFDSEPAFSPVGDKIAFRSNRSGNDEIWVMNSAGSNLLKLTNHSALDSTPAFSPDGTKIAFVSHRDDIPDELGVINREIYVMDAKDDDGDGNGDNLTRLTATADNINDSDTSFSPDGSKIAFRSNRDGNEEIYTMDAATGANVTRFTINAANDRLPDWNQAKKNLTSPKPPKTK